MLIKIVTEEFKKIINKPINSNDGKTRNYSQAHSTMGLKKYISQINKERLNNDCKHNNACNHAFATMLPASTNQLKSTIAPCQSSCIAYCMEFEHILINSI